ncbi:MAG: hypothetical protein MJE66_23560 [Proteobacteria bacterium]|nr:hypothetical protein [Pseudomonadota bacterium]
MHPQDDPQAAAKRARAIALSAALLTPLLLLAAGLIVFRPAFEPSRPTWAGRPDPVSETLPPAARERRSGITLYRLGRGLDQVTIYAATSDAGGVWLGTGRGLVRLTPDGTTTLYRLYSDAPSEWIRELTPLEDGLALTITVAPDNTGGHSVGTFLFDPASERWTRIGEPSRALASNGERLFGVQGRRLVTFDRSGDTFSTRLLDTTGICAEADLAVGDGELWLTHQDTHRAGSRAQAVPCGVLRIRPDGSATAYATEQGLVSGFGRSVVADARGTFVSHGIQGEGLSAYAPDTDRWQGHRGSRNGVYLGANLLAMAPDAIWLGTPDGRRPLVHLKRDSLEAHVVSGIPAEHYVTGMAAGPSGAWVGLARKHWEGTNYTVESRVAFVPSLRARPRPSPAGP